MSRRAYSLGARLLGADDRRRMRVSQTLLGVPSLLLMQGLLLVQWRLGHLAGRPLAVFIGVSLAGCAVFYTLVRLGVGNRISREPSLSAPQMVYAMCCVGWGYALAGPLRAAVLCLMPLILCFGIFALQPLAARTLSHFGIVALGAEMAALALWQPAAYPPLEEGANWVFAAASMAMIRILADRLGRMRARLSAQKAELSEALENIRRLATRDALTGLLNRRAGHDELRRALGHAGRRQQPLVVALADLDHFKQVNDTFGHQVGDRVLQAFAAVAESQMRGSDRVARWGGEEFLFVLPDIGEPQAATLLDRLRQAYAALRLEGLPAGHVMSFSAGVALCHGPADIEAAIERADRAMYRAKVAGRGQTWLSDAPGRVSAAPARAAAAVQGVDGAAAEMA